MEIEDRLASKGVVEDVEGTPRQIYEFLNSPGTLQNLHPNASEIDIFKKLNENSFLNYCRFPGIGPVADRDMVLLNHWNINK